MVLFFRSSKHSQLILQKCSCGGEPHIQSYCMVSCEKCGRIVTATKDNIVERWNTIAPIKYGSRIAVEGNTGTVYHTDKFGVFAFFKGCPTMDYITYNEVSNDA